MAQIEAGLYSVLDGFNSQQREIEAAIRPKERKAAASLAGASRSR